MPITIVNGITTTTSHVGAVLGLREVNKYDDSDFLARVWNFETSKVEEVCYASTRFWSYTNHAEVDATPEVIALASAYTKEKIAKYQDELKAITANVPTVGDIVIMSLKSGKNKALNGVTGFVFNVVVDKFSRSERDPLRYGIEFEDGKKMYFSAKNVFALRATKDAHSSYLELRAVRAKHYAQ